MARLDPLSRRDFLKGSAATALSIGVFGAASGEESKDIAPVVCGFIGTGSQGQLDLARLMRVPGVKCAAVCDIYEPHLKKGMEIGRTLRCYTDYRWMLERKDIQAILIATPLYLHARMAIDAMQAGKHVFTEKMMAYSIDEAKAMVKTARETGRILQVGHQRRYSSQYQHAYEMVKQGVLGKITHVRLIWNRNGSWRRAVPDPKFERLLNWRMYREYSQGLMAELGSHLVHVTNWFLEATPLSVIGMGGIDYWKDGREVYDNVNVIWEYPGGIKVYFQSICSNQFDGCYEQFMGDKGTLVMGNKFLLYREPKAEALAWSEFAHKEKVDGKEAILLDAGATKKLDTQVTQAGEQIGGQPNKDDYLSEMESFIQCVREGKPALCSGEEGLKSAVSCLLANEAMETGKKLEFKPEMFNA